MKALIDCQLNSRRNKMHFRGVGSRTWRISLEHVFLIFAPFSRRRFVLWESTPEVDPGVVIATIVALIVSLGLGFLFGHMNRDD